MILAADNIHVMNPTVASAIRQFNPTPICELAVKSVSRGAGLIDINPGPVVKKSMDIMTFLVRAVQKGTNSRVILDTRDPDAMDAGVRACDKPPVLNGFSLEPQLLQEILPIAINYKTDIVGYLLTPEGRVAATTEERLDIALKLINESDKRGLELDRLIIDPVCVPIIWDDGARQARELLSFFRLLPELAGTPVRTIVGLSNLTSGAKYPYKAHLLEQVFVPLLFEAGLDIALLNIFHERTIEAVRAAAMILDNNIFSWEF